MTIDHLDDLIEYLYRKGYEPVPSHVIIEEHFNGDEVNNDFTSVFVKLDQDGYVNKGLITYSKADQHLNGGIIEEPTYKLSFDGRILYENSRNHRVYSQLKRIERQKNNWRIAKTIAATLNAIIIILIAIGSLKIADKTNKLETQVKTYEDSIQKLNLRASPHS